MKSKIEEREYEIDITNEKVYSEGKFVCDFDIIFNCGKKTEKEFVKNESYVIDHEFLKELVNGQYLKKIAQIIISRNNEFQ
jgi:hypothetical protein